MSAAVSPGVIGAPRPSSDGSEASAATVAAIAFVARHRPDAEALGTALAELSGDPDAFADALRAGFAALADPAYRDGVEHVAPGIGPVHGVRWPLHAAVARSYRRATRRDRPATLLYLADRLFDEATLEERWFAFDLLDRILVDDPERAWQLLRKAAREAGDWITVDSLAHPVGRGVLEEPYRWAELEQLVYSPSPWERRLVGSTVATIPFIDHRRGRTADVAARGLELVGQLIGDDRPEVQKALAWALRSLTLADPDAVATFCDREAERARAQEDGARAWVVRDALPKLEPARAAVIRRRLEGIRRRPGARSTSAAAAAADSFAGPGGLPDPGLHPDAPLSTAQELRRP